MKRTEFMFAGAGAAVMLSSESVSAVAATIPLSGTDTSELKPVDRFMTSFMAKYNISAGQCAVAKDGRLVYARGFGFADKERKTVVSPSARFRIASCTKPITAVAIMKLVEHGHLSLEERAFSILSDLSPPEGASVDPRLHQITVRQLLQHSGGFDNSRFEPQLHALRLASFGHPPPATHTDIIRYMMGKPLAFDPGSKYVYSNFGYNILGRIIERKALQSYGEYIEKEVLNPAGVRSMRLGARTTPSARLPDEVFYFDGAEAVSTWAIYPDELETQTNSYGLYDLAAMDSHGGWIANAVDLTRFLNAVDGSSGAQLLKPQTVHTMLSRPNLPQYKNSGKYYALGWVVAPGVPMSHTGALTFGTLSQVTRLANGVTFALLFNHLPVDGVEAVDVDSVRAVNEVRTWPSGNAYATFT